MLIMGPSNDALRKHGILPPKEAPPPSPSPPPSPTLHDTLEGLTLEELSELGEDQGDDEVERIVEEFRQQRLAELQKLKKARFGRVYPIGREDYTREVTESSSVDQDDSGEHKGKGTGVVCFLYKDGYAVLRRCYFVLSIDLSLPSAFLGATGRLSIFVSLLNDILIRSLSPSLETSVYPIYRIPVFQCSLYIAMAKS